MGRPRIRILTAIAFLCLTAALRAGEAIPEDGSFVEIFAETAGETERMLTLDDAVPTEVPGSGPSFDSARGEDMSLAERYTLPLGVIGEVEPVFIEDIPQAFAARIDTGAAICSLDAHEIKHFERDGKPWVSFLLQHRESGESRLFERRVKRMVTIELVSKETQQRPLVEMTLRMGDMAMQRDFTLNDRSNLTYQVLIGRNLLNGMAAVDVSLFNSLGTGQTESDG